MYGANIKDNKPAELAAQLDRFIPDKLREEADSRLRSRTLVAILLFNILLWPVGEILIYIFRSAPQGQLSRGHLVFTLVAMSAMLALWVFKRYGSLQVVGNWFVATCYFAVLYPYMTLTGIPESVLQTFFFIPAIAFMICGFTPALCWTVLVALSHTGCIIGSNPDTSRTDQLFSLVLVLLIYGALTATYTIYNTIHQLIRQQLQAERNVLDYQAHHDPLTQLSNRSAAEEALKISIRQAYVTGEAIGLAFIDLDKFKPINDEYGHAAGDKVLKEVAGRLNNTIRRCDLAARVGGDEFAVIFRGLRNANDAKLAAGKLLAALREPVIVEDRSTSIDASIGIALFPEHGKLPDQLWQMADTAMYRAKSSGNGISVYHS